MKQGTAQSEGGAEATAQVKTYGDFLSEYEHDRSQSVLTGSAMFATKIPRGCPKDDIVRIGQSVGIGKDSDKPSVPTPNG